MFGQRTGGIEVHVEPEENVSGTAGYYRAATAEPWLNIAGCEALSSHWIRLRYRTGFFQDPVRPLIRFTLINGEHHILPMNGAVLGRAQWVGRVPDQTARISISPVESEGAFTFLLDEVTRISQRAILTRGLLRHPAMALTAVGARLIGSRNEARHCLSFAVGGTPLARYHAWVAERSRPVEPEGIDRFDWRDAPLIVFLVNLDTPASLLRTTLDAVQQQSHGNWRLIGLAASAADAGGVALFRERMLSDARLAISDDHAISDTALVCCLQAGQSLTPYAAGAVAAAALRNPGAIVLYGDEDAIRPDGTLSDPKFKPDFSSFRQQAAPYIGQGVFVRGAAVAGTPIEALFATQDDWLARLLERTPENAVIHLRRVLHRRPVAPLSTQLPGSRDMGSSWPNAVIVIPTRDRARLLGSCIESLWQTDYPTFSVVVVDNGSSEPDALALLENLKKHPRVNLLRAPGPFNFAALCNQGARAADGELVVFLNNDVLVERPDWLKRLAAWAIRPQVGAVGAKLIYPDRRIQHVGVVLGLGDAAGHADRLLPDEGAGYLGRLTAAHEVAAITGAVLAVERSKFEAVGGFDEASFPVLYNDTDLCLRLSRQGWRTVVEPAACLVHVESASRGRPVDPFTRHREERRIFRERWGAVIRDDPYFHPALSLYAYGAELA